MSYSVYLFEPPPSPPEVELWQGNHTSNTSEMWREAGCDLRDLAGLKGAEAAPRLRGAIRELLDDPARYRRHEPDNGWGSYESTVRFLTSFADACEAHPDAEVDILA